jgi:heptosyltransferase-2
MKKLSYKNSFAKEKILIIGPAWVGDMMMAQSLFKLLHQRYPGVILDVVAPAWSAPLLARMPEVNKTITLAAGHGELALGKRYRLGKELRSAKYQQAIVLPNSFKSALVPWWAGIPIRTGWLREMRWGLLNDMRRLDKQRYPLMIERFLALGLATGEALPAIYPLPELIINTESQQAALAKHNLSLVKQQSILVLCPGAEFGAAKRWPEEYYAAVAEEKLKENWSVWLLGSEKDKPVTEKIMTLTHNRCVNLAGLTSLAEAVDLLSLATLVISNDSGLMHIAAALQKPLVVVYGPTSASFTPPLHKKAKILSLALPCQPCFDRECALVHHRCMKELFPINVLTAAAELLEQ